MSYFRFLVSSWGRVDSNHWTPKRTDLQSVAIATMRLPHVFTKSSSGLKSEPMKGLEPPTGWLQISYSTNWVTSASKLVKQLSFSCFEVAKIPLFSQQTKYFFRFPLKFYSICWKSASQKRIFFTPLSTKYFAKKPKYLFLNPISTDWTAR